MAGDLFDPRLTEQRNPRTTRIDLAEPLEIVDLINAEDRTVADAVKAEREEIARAIEIAVDGFKRGGRLIYVGAGTSGRLGVLDATECPPTFGSHPDMVQGIIAGGRVALVRSQEGAEDRSEDGAAAIDSALVTADDFIFGIATSSTTPFVRGALERAAELGARTGFLCCTEPGEGIRRLVDVCIVPLVGAEVIAGSTRMKAGTATKLVLNTITTGSMIRLGKVYGNLMVDLQAMSQKLVDRSQRIVMAVVGCSREHALTLLQSSGGSVKVAIVMGLAGTSREIAQLYLAESDGFVRKALELSDSVNRDPDIEDPFAHYPVGPPDYDVSETLRSALRAMPQWVAGVVDDIDDKRLRRRPSKDRWCAKEQIEHLIDCDDVMGRRVASILAEDGPVIANRDDALENQKTAKSGARDAAIDALLGRLHENRSALAALVEAAPVESLERSGRHERYGDISVYQILRHLVWHDHHHLEAIRRLVTG
jgi:N-acetylmuramic acid 6-phosphate etherase